MPTFRKARIVLSLFAALLIIPTLFAVAPKHVFAAYTWIETQPAGSADKNWLTGAMSGDGTVLLTGVSGGRLYLSTTTGSTWAETQPAGAADKNWRISSINADGSVIL